MSIFLKPLDKIRDKKITQRSALGKLAFLFIIFFIIFIFNFRSLIFVALLEWSRPSHSEVDRMSKSLLQEAKIGSALGASALKRTKEKLHYDSSYRQVSYPNGDIPSNLSSATDFIIRSYRGIGVDLQHLVHEDIENSPISYPQILNSDTNIDHRRTKNLKVFFARKGINLSLEPVAENFAVGDIVLWYLPGNIPHLGIVVPGPKHRSKEKWVVHNLGSKPKWTDTLFEFPIIGHYRYLPKFSDWRNLNP